MSDKLDELTRPIIGIENRTAQEAFDIMVDRIRRALSPGSTGSAEGWVLVPREPTEAMIEAGSTARPYREDEGRDEFVDRNTEMTWSAMLDAAGGRDE